MRTLNAAVPVGILLAMALAGCGDSQAPTVPARLVLVGDTALAVSAGAELQVTVRVTNRRGRGIRDVAVAWHVEAGEGTVTPLGDVTDGAGEARASWAPGTTAGAARLSAEVEGVSPLAIEAIVRAGPPAAIERMPGWPDTLPVGTAVMPEPTVLVTDAHGNPVPGAVVLFEVVGGVGSVSGAQPTTGADGRARVGTWTLMAVGPQALRATVSPLPSVLFEAFGTSESFELSVQSVHLNQGSQTAAGSIGGVAGRPGLLRVVVRASGQNTLSPPVRIRLFQGETLVRERVIEAPMTGVPSHPDLAVGIQTWNVLLPAADIVAGLSVEAVVDPDGVIPVRTPANKRFPRGAGSESLHVEPLPPMRIVFIPVHPTPQGRAGNVTAGNVSGFLGQTRRWIPTAAIETSVQEVFMTDIDLSSGSNWPLLLSELQAKRTLEGAVDEYYHGIVPSFQGSPWGGYAYIPHSPASPFRTGVTYDLMSSAGQLVAHELGHNLGRFHAPCGGPAGVDPSFPHAQAGIGSPGADILSGSVMAGTALRDYMSYCNPQWTSDYTYEGILHWRRADPLAAQAAGGGARAAGPGVLVWGRIHSGGVEIFPAFSVEAPPSPPHGAGEGTVRGTDAAGRELFAFGFEGTRLAHGDDPAERHFAFVVPLSDPAALAAIEVTTPAGTAVRTSSPGAAPGVAAMAMAPDGSAQLRWDVGRFPMGMVRDPRTGRVVAFTRGGEATLPPAAAGTELELLLSDGVRSVRARD